MKWIWESMELMYSRNWFLCSVFLITMISSTYCLHSLGELFDVLTTLVLKSSIIILATIALMGARSRCSSGRTAVMGDDVMDGHECSVESCNLLQFAFNDGNTRVNWHRGKQCFVILRCDTLPFLKFDVLNMFHKVLVF